MKYPASVSQSGVGISFFKLHNSSQVVSAASASGQNFLLTNYHPAKYSYAPGISLLSSNRHVAEAHGHKDVTASACHVMSPYRLGHKAVQNCGVIEKVDTY